VLIATDVTHSVVCVSVCVLISEMCCVKMTKPIEMLFGGGEGVGTHVGPRNHILDVDQNWTNPLTAMRGDKLMMQPFARLL